MSLQKIVCNRNMDNKSHENVTYCSYMGMMIKYLNSVKAT